MGYAAGLLTAAIINEHAREVAREHRTHLARGSLLWLVDLAASEFPGRPAFVMAGARDRDNRHLRQVATYLAHTALQIEETVCASVFGLHKAQATRAVQAIEERRQADATFNAQIERLEAVIRRWLLAARVIDSTIRPVPPTQGLVKRPAAVSRSDTGGAAPAVDISGQAFERRISA